MSLPTRHGPGFRGLEPAVGAEGSHLPAHGVIAYQELGVGRKRGGRGAAGLVSENFYWRGTEPGNYRALRTLPQVSVLAISRSERQGERYLLETELENRSPSPALAVRVVAVRAETGDRILPVRYSDNFVALMPGEKRTIRTEVLAADARGEEPRIVVEGWNVFRFFDLLRATVVQSGKLRETSGKERE